MGDGIFRPVGPDRDLPHRQPLAELQETALEIGRAHV